MMQAAPTMWLELRVAVMRQQWVAWRQPKHAHSVGQHRNIHVVSVAATGIHGKAQVEALLQQRRRTGRQLVWHLVPVVGRTCRCGGGVLLVGHAVAALQLRCSGSPGNTRLCCRSTPCQQTRG
eukprot:366307-Chlamydomonas_euryale.AAC.10